MVLDIVIRGGEIVTSAGALGVADVGIQGGKIVEIGAGLDGARVLDASGKLVIPGGVDPHVHLSSPPRPDDGQPRWVDDFTTGSAAALSGGITTVGNMTFPAAGESPQQSLARDMALARQQTIVDIFFHPVLAELTPEYLGEIDGLLATGCNSIKIFLVAETFDTQNADYVEAIRRAGANGLISLLHCEDHSLIEDATARLLTQGKGSLRYYAESRPIVSEVVATQRAVAIAEQTGSPVYIVHLSSERALDVCVEAQTRGVPVYVETRPLYLHLTSERFGADDGAKYVGQPPLREHADVEALWAGLRQGVIHTLGTDHAPWSLAAKLDAAHSLTNLRPGVADLQTMLPMLYSEGVRTGRITLARFIELISTNAAKLFGLFPRKGTIAVGSDADLVIFDPNRTRTIEPSMLKSASDYSPYEGWDITGWPDVVLRRGEIVYRDDEVVGQPGSGEIVARGATQAL